MSFCNGNYIVAALCSAIILSGCGSNSAKSKPAPIGDSPAAPEGSLTIENAVWSKAGRWQVVGTWVGQPDGPDGSAANALDLAFYRIDGSPANLIKIDEIKPWMTVHGHGTPTKNMVVEPDATTPNTVHVKNIRFVMSGPWEIFVTASGDSDAAADQAILKFNVR